MWWDRFDIVEAYFVYFMEYHEGQFSEKYARLSKMYSYFKPAVNLSDRSNLSENGQYIYDNLVNGGYKKD